MLWLSFPVIALSPAESASKETVPHPVRRAVQPAVVGKVGGKPRAASGSLSKPSATPKHRDAPTNKSLRDVFERATRLVISDGSSPVITITDNNEISGLKESLTINERVSTGYILESPDIGIVLFDGNQRIAVLGIIGPIALRWSERWDCDGIIANGKQMVTWLAARGLAEPKKILDEMSQEQAKDKEQTARWLAAMPECLRPLWKAPDGFNTFTPNADQAAGREAATSMEQADSDKSPAAQAMALMEKNYPDRTALITGLLSWVGSGAGPWSGYPSYEQMAEDILLRVPTKDIVAALEANAPTDPVIEGAARYFASWDFSQAKPGEIRLLPDDLKKTLLDHSLKSTDDDRREQARKAFQTAKQ